MSSKAQYVEIKGEMYTVTVVAYGWKVTACKDPAGHSHLVFKNDEGRPCRCSCPHQVHRGGCCKHMKAIVDLLPPTWTPNEEGW